MIGGGVWHDQVNINIGPRGLASKWNADPMPRTVRASLATQRCLPALPRGQPCGKFPTYVDRPKSRF